MSYHNREVKKFFLIVTALLLGCDVGLLFFAEKSFASDNSPSQSPAIAASTHSPQEVLQLQQLQQVMGNSVRLAQNDEQQNQAPAVATQPTKPPQSALSPLADQATVVRQPQQSPPPTQTLQPRSSAPTMSPELISEMAFSSVAKSTLPMTPDQIHRLRQLYTTTQLASSAPAFTPPRPVARSQLVNLAPGATPPPVRLAQGFVTSLVFLDSTGAPWPIDAYDIGDPTSYNIQWNKSDNTLMIQSSKLYGYGNLAVRLRGLTTPVMLTLIPGQHDVDYRVDLHISGLGPNADPLSGKENLPNSANPVLLGILSGVPPEGSRELKLANGGESQVWLANDRLFIRTRVTVLSPGWLSTMTSADGMKAYEMQKTPMILVSQHGKAVQLKIEGL